MEKIRCDCGRVLVACPCGQYHFVEEETRAASGPLVPGDAYEIVSEKIVLEEPKEEEKD